MTLNGVMALFCVISANSGSFRAKSSRSLSHLLMSSCIKTCLLLVITFTMRVCNIRLSGMLGYWLCMIFLSENLNLRCSINGSTINLTSFTIERYMKVVHSGWGKKLLRKWVTRSAAAFAWIAGIVCGAGVSYKRSDGVLVWKSGTAALIHDIWNFVSFYIIVMFSRPLQCNVWPLS